MTLQSSTNTLLSSQTTTARPTRTTPAGRPAPTGSKGITYTNPATNANPTKPNTTKTLEKQANHRRVANTQKPPHRQQQTTRDQAKYTVKNVSPGVSRPPTRDSNRHADPRRGCHCRSQSSGRTEASAAREVGITMRISSQYDGPHLAECACVGPHSARMQSSTVANGLIHMSVCPCCPQLDGIC
mgnify:FL=1